MARLVHLNALQALEAALRHGSLRGAAAELGMTPAAAGQRVRTLERFLGTLLLERGPGGVRPTATARRAGRDLVEGFAALHRAAATLDLDRTAALRLQADPDWLDLWLAPQRAALAAALPEMELHARAPGRGAADLIVSHDSAPDGAPLAPEWLVPVVSPRIHARLHARAPAHMLEDFPLQHLDCGPPDAPEHGWPDWVARFGARQSAADRGLRYSRAGPALRAAEAHVGALLCPLTLAAEALRAGRLRLLFGPAHWLPARHAFRLRIAAAPPRRRQAEALADWLRQAARQRPG